jgi:LmbE family N-acetylglucosaminyl deacetylase
LAPHPDDETFGCGGTIRMLADAGVSVDVLFLTRGERGTVDPASSSATAQDEIREIRQREAHRACDVLGVRQVRFLNGCDTRLCEQRELAATIADVLQTERYQRVFCPWQHDGHDDHKATFTLLQQAVSGGAPATSFWLYEVWTPFVPNTFVPIDALIDVKCRAMDQYRSQLSQLNYREGFLGLAAYRALTCPPATHAEAFLVCDRQEFLRAG